MNLRKTHIVLILLAAVVLGFIGAYAGVKIAQPEQVNQEPISLSEEDKGLDDEEIQEANVPENMDKVVQAYNVIKDNYLEDVENKQLIEGAIEGMLNTLEDPYSAYMDVETMEQFNETIESSFEGIGAEVSMVNGKVTIIAPIKDSPAEEAGLRPNDQIISVDNESVEGLDLYEAVDKIRGEQGSEVIIEIQRSGVSDTFDVTIVRDNIPLETVYNDVQSIDGKKTGILEITSFSERTADEFEEQLTALEEDGIEGLVIDVRGNPGGLLNSVQDILESFIPSDTPIVQIEDQEGEKSPYYSDLESKKDYPISVVIDEGSASASEILAVAMKEVGYNVVGTNSYGKGTVQQALPLGDGSNIKLTFYKWLSPNGNWIHEEGVKPTIEMEQPAYFYANPVQVDDEFSYDQSDEKIENIQIMLDGLGYDPGRLDGYFSRETEEAVKAFQNDNNVNATGDVDQDTAGMIETKMVEKIRSGEDDKQLEEALDTLYK
ncbi:S41 family peptidase [Virgibacillus byunsanensis]|uniref:S41 family peptidase n=1 Tax=Virgibacillus byunsanensis TaxID=570945 RepID=A0ABW3LKL8_9BACI